MKSNAVNNNILFVLLNVFNTDSPPHFTTGQVVLGVES